MGFWRQDMFSGGPMLLGSAIPSVASQAHIGVALMAANGPHWCEDPLLDRQNELYQLTRALGRIRRSCSVLRSGRDEEANVIMRRADTDNGHRLAYWKLASDHEQMSPSAMLVVLTLEGHPNTNASKYAMPLPTLHTEGQAFIDLLHPERTAVVARDPFTLKLCLLIPAHMAPVNVAIYAPREDIEPDQGRSWSICAKANLPPLPPNACKPKGYVGPWLTIAIAISWAGLVCATLVWNARSSVYLCVVGEPTKPVTPGLQVRFVEGAGADPKPASCSSRSTLSPCLGISVTATDAFSHIAKPSSSI